MSSLNSKSGTVNDFHDAEKNATEKWTGKIALPYPTDYGYATSGGSVKDRASCLAADLLYEWGTDDFSDCSTNNWLTQENYVWTLTSKEAESYGSVCTISNIVTCADAVGARYNFNLNDVLPIIYLQEDVKISGGDGSESNPYQLSL